MSFLSKQITGAKAQPDIDSSVTDVSMARIASVAAQDKVMETPPRHVFQHGIRLFEVPSGWQAKAIMADTSVTIVRTLAEIESALQAPGQPVIFIPNDAAIDMQKLEEMAHRIGTVKTLFKEVA